MTGHRSLAETEAKLDGSDVRNWANTGQLITSGTDLGQMRDK
jgi:hypothetical protein